MINGTISVSTLSVENDRLLDYIKELEFAKADRLFCEVRDGLIGKPATFGEGGVAVIKSSTSLPVDVRLMVYQPHKHLAKYLKKKPDSILVQYEHFSKEKQLRKALQRIQRKHVRSGLILGTAIPISYILPFIPYVDEIMILGTDQDEGEIEQNIFDKISNLLELKKKFKKDLVISVRGGVTFANCNKLFEAGVNVLVVDKIVYDSFSKSHTIENLKNPNSTLVK